MQSELHLREEVDFWRRFLHDWERDRTEPVPQKLRDLLDYAEWKLMCYVESEGEHCGPSQDTQDPSADSPDRSIH